MKPRQTLRQGLQRYYQTHPDFVRDRDLQLGWLTIPWRDLQRHDIMHVVTGYSTDLDDEMRLVGFLLTGLSWRRPWTYYVQNIGTLMEVLWRTAWGQAVGTEQVKYRPHQILRFYWAGVQQGLRVRRPINAYLDPNAVMDQELRTLRQAYGIQNAGAWDPE
ncbi:MAG: hypothetical protein F6K42_08660 [Leptolyngbya sp. SIO1D8]|nr:hypothetical protein [Leptolyngbya sp. SIO1D8]